MTALPVSDLSVPDLVLSRLPRSVTVKQIRRLLSQEMQHAIEAGFEALLDGNDEGSADPSAATPFPRIDLPPGL
eukprot:4949506-Pleurochrysis_carterae.AAC.1